MGTKIIEWLFPPKQKKQTKPMTKSEQMNHATRQAFLHGRKLNFIRVGYGQHKGKYFTEISLSRKNVFQAKISMIAAQVKNVH